MTEFNFGMMMSQENQIKQIPLDMLVPYHNHQFTIYEGERRDDMVESIKQNGVLTPIIVRPTDENKYEILIGHNRWNCAKLAGLETIPGIIKENLSDEEAEVYVIESNLIQRGFNDLKISERARVLALRYEDMFSQGKRNDIINELMALENTNSDNSSEENQEKHNSREEVGKEYGLSRNTVARLLRIDKLCDGLKKWVDEELISIRAGVELSYLSRENQEKIFNMNCADTTGNMMFSITESQAKELRALYSDNSIQTSEITQVLGNNEKKKSESGKNVKLSKEVYKKYFDSLDKEEVSEIVEKALEMYFKQIYD